MNKWISIILFFTLLTSCKTDTVESDLIQNIPERSRVVIALSDIQEIKDLLKNNHLFEQLESLSRIQEIETAASFLNDYELKSTSIVTLSMEGKNQVVITLLTDAIENNQDSTTSIKSRIYNNVAIYEMSHQGNTYYTAHKNGIHIASSSILVLESLIRRNLKNYVFDKSFATLYKRTGSDFGLYIKASDEQWLSQFLLGKNKVDANNFADWYHLDPSMEGNSLYMNGLIVYQDSLKQKQTIYNNIEPKENQLAYFAPVVFESLSSTTYTETSQLLLNLSRHKSRNLEHPKLLKSLFENSNEVSTVELSNGTAIVFTLLPYESLFIDLDSISSEKSTYRDQFIYKLATPLNTRTLTPLIPDLSINYLALLDDFVILTSHLETLEQITASYQNGTTLSSQNWWKEARDKMSSSSTLLNVTHINQLKGSELSISDKDANILKKIDDSSIKSMISQYVHEDGYAFYRMMVPYSNTAADQPLVSQVGTYKPDTTIIAGPYLFPNHLNNTHDVAFQTKDLQLTLISNSGEVYWTKELTAPILGEIENVDTYKNDRKQLLFATSDKVYLLDRNGNDVDKFPFDPKATITQPLSVFDYDTNRNYRFVVTTGADLKMLDAKGNNVRGFKYKSDGTILNSPRHFRKGNKDYIAFTTDKNQLKLLSRTGTVRTKVKNRIESKSNLYFNNNLIQLVNSDDQLLHINPTTGKVTITTTTLEADSHISFTSRSQLIQNKNVVHLNGSKQSLPYGTYTPAQWSRINNKDYVTMVDNGESKVYILNNEGSIIPFMPVYGNQIARIAGGNQRYLVTLDQNEILIYKW